MGSVLNLRTIPFNGSDFAVWPTFYKFRFDYDIMLLYFRFLFFKFISNAKSICKGTFQQFRRNILQYIEGIPQTPRKSARKSNLRLEKIFHISYFILLKE